LINKSHHPRAPTSPANHREKEVSIVTLEYKIPSIFQVLKPITPEKISAFSFHHRIDDTVMKHVSQKERENPARLKVSSFPIQYIIFEHLRNPRNGVFVLTPEVQNRSKRDVPLSLRRVNIVAAMKNTMDTATQKCCIQISP